jgi:hypothetical protein
MNCLFLVYPGLELGAFNQIRLDLVATLPPASERT